MTIRSLFTVGLCMLLTSCSPHHWMAQYYMFKAESAVEKAGSLKAKKVPFEKRTAYYEEACEYFAKAYERNPDVFTLSRIETASDCCWKGGNQNLEELFKEFEELYIKNHPQEYEHGDSGVSMMDMGG